MCVCDRPAAPTTDAAALLDYGTAPRREGRIRAPAVVAGLLLLRASGAAAAPSGPEFQVNSTGAGDQRLPAVAALAGGTFLVAWESEGQNGDESAIVARRLAADLTPLGDERVAYPMLAEATRLGLRVVNVHKGFPGMIGSTAATYVQSRDLPRVSADWPRLEFVAYHSGYFSGRGGGEFLDVVRGIRQRRNVHAEIGSAFATAFTESPLAAAHLLGSLQADAGGPRPGRGAGCTASRRHRTGTAVTTRRMPLSA
jgi:hypothetical protein